VALAIDERGIYLNHHLAGTTAALARVELTPRLRSTAKPGSGSISAMPYPAAEDRFWL